METEHLLYGFTTLRDGTSVALEKNQVTSSAAQSALRAMHNDGGAGASEAREGIELFNTPSICSSSSRPHRSRWCPRRVWALVLNISPHATGGGGGGLSGIFGKQAKAANTAEMLPFAPAVDAMFQIANKAAKGEEDGKVRPPPSAGVEGGGDKRESSSWGGRSRRAEATWVWPNGRADMNGRRGRREGVSDSSIIPQPSGSWGDSPIPGGLARGDGLCVFFG